MKDGYLSKQETLLGEIRNWKNTENICKGVYDEEALKSRSFLKLKMQTFRQLYGKYDGVSLTLDEKALHRMLRYHFKKIERKLYPNLLVRLGRRAFSSLSRKVEALVQGQADTDLTPERKVEAGITTAGAGGKIVSSVGKEREQAGELGKLPEGWWVNDLGRRAEKPDQNKSQGYGLH